MAREGLLKAQAQKMQGGMPVGPEGAMPPSSAGTPELAMQQRLRDMMQQRMQATQGQEAAMSAGAPPGQLSAPPMPPQVPGPQSGLGADPRMQAQSALQNAMQRQGMQQGMQQAQPPMQAQAPQQTDMMNQQQRFQEIIKRLQQQQNQLQPQGGAPLG